MKPFLLLPLFFLTLICNATNYYVSNTGDNRDDGLSSNSPWASIDKVNSSKFSPNDVVYFKRGDTFYGGLKVAVDIAAYGAGAKPIITGFSKVEEWIKVSGNIWESKDAVSSLPTCNMVTVNGNFAAIGRYPNADEQNGGFLTYNTTSRNNVVKCQDLAGENWTGADVVMKVERYIISRRKISAQNGVNLTFNPIYVYKPTNNFGLFLQNDSKTLDKNNEWYYNPITKKLKIYSISEPVNVQLATIDTLVRVFANNINISDIEFSGSNTESIAKPNKNDYRNITIQNCVIKFSGCNAINFKVGKNVNVLISNCVITYTNSNGIILGSGCEDAQISNNILQNTGSVAGMSIDSLGNYWGISTSGKSTLIEKNRVINTGYVAISFAQNNSIVRNNFIDTFSHVLDDGGGIYTFTGAGNTNFTGRKIEGNIVMNGIGVKYGANVINSSSMAAEGIYIDDNSSGIEIIGNTVINCVKSGILLHNARNVILRDNTLYNNKFGLALSHDGIGSAITGTTITNNIFASKDAEKFPATYFSVENDYSKIGFIDSNIYARPILDSATIKMEYPNMGWGYRTLAFWKAHTGTDQHSKKSFRSILNKNEIDLQYNASSIPRTYNFNGLSKMDLAGNVYNNSIQIPAWGSKVLLSNVAVATNKLPLANAGLNDTIEYPINSITLNGSGTDSDGTIVSYSWVKLSGQSANIVSDEMPTTVVTNLTEGIYQFELTVTDNQGASGKDTIQITVKSSIEPNKAPTATAGNNVEITLPISTTTVSGEGTDVDGTINLYAWRNISGPLNAIIVTPNRASSSINNLEQGVYQFELTVTDNQGASAKDTLQVIVNSAIIPNVAPTAKAGNDAEITLPISTTTVSGEGTDKDGTIISYAWRNISGPSNAIIVTPNRASSSINNLEQGVYQFELTVTDNQDGTAKDTIQIIVQTAIVFNQAPTSKAGNDAVITLPKSTTTVSGEGTDIDGNIVLYAWKNISGPPNAFIVTPNKASSSINNLEQGVYQFVLTVYDDRGAIGTDTIEIKVNPVTDTNQPPIASAGFNTTITLPTSTTTVSGIGIDSDGTITGYEWVKISGPIQGRIVKPFAATTSINGLIQGVYRFQFSVKDNDGAVASDTIELNVYPSPYDLLPAVNPANIVNGLEYKYYEGVWNFMPDFNVLSPVKNGFTNYFDISVANRSRDMGITFSGYIDVPEDGLYTFFTTSDDGSFLYIDDLLVVNNDGKHPAVEKSGVVGLKAGKHYIKALYFQGPSGMSFSVGYQSDNLAKQLIPPTSLYRDLPNGKPVGKNINNIVIAPIVDKPLSISCYPNPTITDFNLNIAGVSNEKVIIQVVNTNGEVIYTTSGTSNKTYRFGYEFTYGIYLIRVIQGNNLQVIKAIKQ